MRKLVLNDYYVPGSDQGFWEISANKREENLSPHGACLLVGEDRLQAADYRQ